MYAYVPYLQPWFADSFGMSKSVFGLWSMALIVTGFMGGSMVRGATLSNSGDRCLPSLSKALERHRRLMCQLMAFLVKSPPVHSPIWQVALVLEASFGTYVSLLIGFGCFGGGYLLIGPSPLLPFIPAAQGVAGYITSILGWEVLLFGNAIPVALGAPLSLKFAMEFGLDEEEASVQTASFNITLMALGLFFGPVFGGWGADNIGVPWTNTALGLNAIVMSAIGIFLIPFFEKKGTSELV